MVKERLQGLVKKIDNEISILKAAKQMLMEELEQQSLFPNHEEIHIKQASSIKDLDSKIEDAISDKAILGVLIKRELW